jgi:transposase
MPVKTVLDNARYQRCKAVMELAESLDTELLFLPAYSPNMNIVERLWRFTKKQILYGQYYDSTQKFHEVIRLFFAEASTKYASDLNDLLILKFQFFEDGDTQNLTAGSIAMLINSLLVIVGVPRFELGTPCSQSLQRQFVNSYIIAIYTNFLFHFKNISKTYLILLLFFIDFYHPIRPFVRPVIRDIEQLLFVDPIKLVREQGVFLFEGVASLLKLA